MDFADATHVVLAEKAGIDDIFTLDHRGFRAYRTRGKKEFRLLPKFL
jgi:predicted nucleic acid-binding protein